MARFRTTLAVLEALVLAAACGGGGSSGGTGAGGGANAGGANAGGTASGGTAGVLGFGGSSASGSGGSSASGGAFNDAACGHDTYAGEEVPLDMYILMDESGSMGSTTTSGGQTVWDACKGALIDFVNAPESGGIGVGIGFFPPPASANCNPLTPPPCPVGCIPFGPFGCIPAEACDPNMYLPPTVMIQLLPGVAPEIVNALNAVTPNGGTPTVPAMQSAVIATTAYAAQVPSHKVIIVLVTDGDPNDCTSTIQGVADEAAKALANVPKILTFVVGIGNIAGLDQVAAAGGTQKALAIDASADPGKDFLDAMNEIRGQALSCEFVIPVLPPGQTFDPNQVNVYHTPPGGQPTLVYYVEDATKCDLTLGGWYYDNPADPKSILLCPASCDTVKGSKGAVDIQVGCVTIPIPT